MCRRAKQSPMDKSTTGFMAGFRTFKLTPFDIEMRFTMNKLLSCRFNMDTNRVEAQFEDGTTLAIDCIAVEDDYGSTPAQRAELDWLLYNKPLYNTAVKSSSMLKCRGDYNENTAQKICSS